MGDLVEFLPPKARREAPQSPTISVEATSETQFATDAIFSLALSV
jgi:hypothetical protein